MRVGKWVSVAVSRPSSFVGAVAAVGRISHSYSSVIDFAQ